MPFDFDRYYFEEPKQTPARKNRAKLVTAIREYTGEWDFRWHTTCALAIAQKVLNLSDNTTFTIGPVIGLDMSYRGLFLLPEDYGVDFAHQVTKEMVADALEAAPFTKEE